MENILQQLIDLLKDIAPEVWEVLILQVSIEARQYLVWAIFTGVLAVLTIGLGVWSAYKNINSITFDIILTGVIIAGLSIAFWLGWSNRIANPDFYAIEILLDRLPK